jgi:hypothetical protein
MSIQNRMNEHFSRWNIREPGFDFDKFRNRIVACFQKAIGKRNDVLLAVDAAFMKIMGLDPRKDLALQCSEGFFATNMCKQILEAESYEQLVTAVQVVFFAFEECESEMGYYFAWSDALDSCIQAAREAIDLTPNAGVSIVEREGVTTLYPSGAAELDEHLVNRTLQWLSRFPDAAKKFEHALEAYLTMEPKKTRNLLDDLRVCLELLLRDILANTKSLENQEKFLLPWLQKNGVHQQVINMYQMLLAKFCSYQNDAVKHGEKWSPIEVEFMIYLTGTFIRLLQQLHEQPPRPSQTIQGG